MKVITAYIRHDRADIVIEKLEEAGVKGITLLDANALAAWADQEAYSFSIEYVQKYSKVVKIELICNNEDSDKLIDIISKFGHTGKCGDGWIFVSPVEKAVRIRTGQINDFHNL